MKKLTYFLWKKLFFLAFLMNKDLFIQISYRDHKNHWAHKVPLRVKQETNLPCSSRFGYASYGSKCVPKHNSNIRLLVRLSPEIHIVYHKCWINEVGEIRTFLPLPPCLTQCWRVPKRTKQLSTARLVVTLVWRVQFSHKHNQILASLTKLKQKRISVVCVNSPWTGCKRKVKQLQVTV